MNRFAKHFGVAAKHLRQKGEKPKEINYADVAELVDARDLKCPAVSDPSSLSCKTPRIRPVETAANRSRLQNIFGEQKRSRQPQKQDHLFPGCSCAVLP